jgi:hypothetical protein
MNFDLQLLDRRARSVRNDQTPTQTHNLKPSTFQPIGAVLDNRAA